MFVIRYEELRTTIDGGHLAKFGYLFAGHQQSSFEARAVGLGYVLTAEKSLSLAHVSRKISTIDQYAVAFRLGGLDLDLIEQGKHVLERIFKCRSYT